MLEAPERPSLVTALDESLLGLQAEAGGAARARLRGRLTLGPASIQTRDAEPGSVAGMEEARRVLERLALIEQLEREHAPSGELLDQLRELVREAGGLAPSRAGAGRRGGGARIAGTRWRRNEREVVLLAR